MQAQTDPGRMSASARMTALAARLGTAQVRLGEVVDGLGDTGLGLTLLLLMLPVFITIPGLPVGVVFGFVVSVLGVQIMRGAHSLHLPARLRARVLDAPQVRRVLNGSAPWLARTERWLHPGRLSGLVSPGMQRLLGFVLVLDGLALAVPLPFGNPPPALAIVAIGLGLMERDGLAVLVGLVVSVLALAWVGGLILGSAELLAWTGRLLGL